MAKFNIGDVINFGTPTNNYIVKSIDVTNNSYGLDLLGAIYNEDIYFTDRTATLVTPAKAPVYTNKFNVGDKIVSNIEPLFQAVVLAIDAVHQMYTLEVTSSTTCGTWYPIGRQWSWYYITVEKDFKLLNSSTTTATTPVKPKVDYVGKVYKMIGNFAGMHYALYKNEIVIVKEASKIYHGEYTIVRLDKQDERGISLRPNEFAAYMVEYTPPKCTCGIEKTYNEVHRMKAPAFVHYDWCSLYKQRGK